MSFVFESSEEKLCLSAVPIGFGRDEQDRPALIVNFASVTTPTGKIIHSGYEEKISLDSEWHERLLGKNLKMGQDGITFDLALTPPEGEALKILKEVLIGADHNVYTIADIKTGPNPYTPFR